MTHCIPHMFIRWQTMLTLVAVKANRAVMRFWQWNMT
jgi:hypothetical protein